MFQDRFHLDAPVWRKAIHIPSSSADPYLTELLVRFPGASFNEGLYRLVGSEATKFWTSVVENTFPKFSRRLTCFAFDWLGRAFALDAGRVVEGKSAVVLLEPGTGEVLEIPCNAESFHESELLQFSEEALAESFYRDWRSTGGAAPQPSECIGYRRPLFLGGADTTQNLEVTDLAVYWEIAGQLLERTRGLPLGTPIGKVVVRE